MRKPKVNIIPWVECNSDRDKDLAHVVRGIQTWYPITKTVIVSTVPGKEHIYRELRRSSVPLSKRVCVIPGVKTWPMLDGFDSLKGWKAVAKSVEVILKHCPDATRVVLENETAMKPYIDGKQKINLKRLERALLQLPRRDRLTYLWWPTYAGHALDTQDRYFAVVETVDCVLGNGARFIGRHMASPAAPSDIWMIHAALRFRCFLHNCCGTPSPIPLVWCGGDKRHSKAWHYKQVPSVLDMVEGGEAIINPESKNWVEAAKSLAAILPKRKPAGRPRRG